MADLVLRWAVETVASKAVTKVVKTDDLDETSVADSVYLLVVGKVGGKAEMMVDS
jgi:hypothetical protein